MNNLSAAARTTELGIEVVLGWDTPAQLRQFGSSIHTKLFMDTNNEFRNRLGISSVPSWYVVNEKDEIVKKFRPSYLTEGSDREQLEFVVKNNAPQLSPLIGG